MKTKMLKSENEMSRNFSALESFLLTNEEMVKLFGGTTSGNTSGSDNPPPIVKENDDD